METITINSLSEYLGCINKLESSFRFYFSENINVNEIEYIINSSLDRKPSNKSLRDREIEEIWNKISKSSDQLFTFVFNNYYGKVSHVSKYYFRGLSSDRHLNAPGIYRSTLPSTKDENYFFNEIQVRCPSAFSGMKNINKLTYMQHYGCPTRLLDISSNPLVSLYFACLENKNQNGVVHVFGVPESDILYEQSDRVQMLSKLAEFKKHEQDKILQLAYIYLLKGKFPQSPASKYTDSVIERLYHAIKRDNAAFEREMVPLDLLKPIFVQVNKDNPRILKQDGAFIVSGLDLDENDSNNKISCYSTLQFVIPANSKSNLRKELENVCINQASLFPEVDQVADYLKRK